MSASSTNEWARISALFNEIVELDSADRDRRLADIGATDPALKTAVESMLAADAMAEEQLAKFDRGVSDVVRQYAASVPFDSRDPLGLAGTTMSHFRVIDHLASGGMGIVYRAEDIRLHRPVALKFPLPHYQVDAAMKERFIREAQSAGALEHVNLCTVYEVGESDKGLFLAMPLYAGETLKQRLAARQPLAVGEALAIARQIANGLACAHDAGVIHRDLKPGNVMLLPDGTAKILDFGLAKVGDISVTKSGATLGTISYMSPEQIRGAKVDARSDLWSLGVLLYEMLTGVRPFAGEHDVSIAHAILHNDPKPPATVRDGLPRRVQDMVLALLQKDPRSRYTTAGEVARDIEAVQGGAAPAFQPPLQPRAMTWLRKRRTAMALVAVAAITAALATMAPRISSALNKPTKNTEAHRFYLRALEYEKHGTMWAAESLYTRALALDTGFALARARLAIVYAACRAGGSRDCYERNPEDPRVDRLDQIKSHAQAALTRQPRLADAHFAMGLYWEQREEPDRALAEYKLALKGLGKSGDLHAAIGRAYRSQGRWDEAIEELERGIAINPDDVISMADLATTYSRLRRYEESARMWERYLALSPDAYAAWIIKGNVYLRWHGTLDSLKAIYARMPAEWQKRSPGTRVLIARIENRPLDAIRALDEAPPPLAEGVEPERPRHILRAQLYSEMGDSTRARAYYDSARLALKKATRARARDFRTQISLGLTYAGLGLAREAKRAADSAMALMPPSRTVPAGTTAMRGAAEIFARIPEYHGAAIELLDRLMQMPAGREASVPLLRIDPEFKTLRADPRFKHLLAKYSRYQKQ